MYYLSCATVLDNHSGGLHLSVVISKEKFSKSTDNKSNRLRKKGNMSQYKANYRDLSSFLYAYFIVIPSAKQYRDGSNVSHDPIYHQCQCASTGTVSTVTDINRSYFVVTLLTQNNPVLHKTLVWSDQRPASIFPAPSSSAARSSIGTDCSS